MGISGVPKGGWGVEPPPKFWSYDKAELNSQFRGKYIRNNLIRIRVSLICRLSGTPDYPIYQLFHNNSRTVHIASSPAPLDLRQQYQCWTSYPVVHYIVLLIMGILMPEKFWAKEHGIKFRCVASSWFIILPNVTTYGHMNIQFLSSFAIS
jgi:hypothetical protein